MAPPTAWRAARAGRGWPRQGRSAVRSQPRSRSDPSAWRARVRRQRVGIDSPFVLVSVRKQWGTRVQAQASLVLHGYLTIFSAPAWPSQPVDRGRLIQAIQILTVLTDAHAVPVDLAAQLATQSGIGHVTAAAVARDHAFAQAPGAGPLQHIDQGRGDALAARQLAVLAAQ